MEIKKSVGPSAEYELYKRIKLIGQGAFGKAYLVECLHDNSQWVIKQMDLNSMSEPEQKQTLKEFRVLESLNHPNVVKFRQIYQTKKGQLCMVMQYADGGDLAKRVKDQKGKFFQESVILDWFTQICLALQHVHDRQIIHRDLKGQNIFLTSKNIIKLGDFGIARVLSRTIDQAKTMVGTPYYLSPEIIESKPYSFKTDIWSLGVILYELCALQPPFNADSLHFLALKIVKGAYTPLPSHYSKQLKNLIAMMLNVDPVRRPSIHDILKLPVVTNRIQNFLSETIRSSQFSHTILHNKQFVNPSVNMLEIKSVVNEAPCPAHLLPKQSPAVAAPQAGPKPVSNNIVSPPAPPALQPKPQTPNFNNRPPSQPNLPINKPPSLTPSNAVQPNKLSNPSPSNQNNKIPSKPASNVAPPPPPPSNFLIPRPPSGNLISNKEEKQEDRHNPFDPKNAPPAGAGGKPVNYHYVNNNREPPQPPTPNTPSNNGQRPETAAPNLIRKNSAPGPALGNQDRQGTPQKEVKKEQPQAFLAKPVIPPHPSSANNNPRGGKNNDPFLQPNSKPAAAAAAAPAPPPPSSNIPAVPKKNIARSTSNSDQAVKQKLVANKQQEEEKLKQMREQEALREQAKREKLQKEMEEREIKEESLRKEKLLREQKREEQRKQMHDDIEMKKKDSSKKNHQSKPNIEEKQQENQAKQPTPQNLSTVNPPEKQEVIQNEKLLDEEDKQETVEIIKMLESQPEIIENFEDQDQVKMIMELNDLLAGVHDLVQDIPEDNRDFFNLQTKVLDRRDEDKYVKNGENQPIMMEEQQILDDTSDDDDEEQRDDDTDEPSDIDSTRDIINFGKNQKNEKLKPLSEQEERSISYLHDFSQIESLKDYLIETLGQEKFQKAHIILQNQFVDNDLNRLEEIHGKDQYQTLFPFLQENQINDCMALLVTLVILEDNNNHN